MPSLPYRHTEVHISLTGNVHNTLASIPFTPALFVLYCTALLGLSCSVSRTALTTSPAPPNPILRHAPPPKSPPPPLPLPEGYHVQQSRGLDPSGSRPLSPMQQFTLMVDEERWGEEVAGEPSEEDLKVTLISFTPLPIITPLHNHPTLPH